jgi:hypothetical protein
MPLALLRDDQRGRTARARTPRTRVTQALVQPAQGALLLDQGPAPRQGAGWTLLVRSMMLLFVVAILAAVVGPSGSMVAFVGMLWLAPWLGLLAIDSRLVQRIRTARELGRRRRRRRVALRWLRHTPLLAGPPSSAGAGWQRVRGRVLDGTGFVSVGGRRGCVLARYVGLVGGPGNREPRAEVHAWPSCRLLVGEEVVEVELTRARYVERPVGVDPSRAEASGVQHEQTVAAGDEIEVLGYVVPQIDQSTGGYRTPGLKLVMRGDGHRPLVLGG